MASAPTRRQERQCDRAAPPRATQPLPTGIPNNLQQGRGNLLRWRLTVMTTGTTTPNLGTCAHSGFPPRSSTNRRHSELHSPNETEWRHQGHAARACPNNWKTRQAKESSTHTCNKSNKVTRRIDTHANIVGSDAVRCFKNQQGGLGHCCRRLPTYS